jgi:hypothetical protein
VGVVWAWSRTPSMRRVRVREYMEVYGVCVCACEGKHDFRPILSLYYYYPVAVEDDNDEDGGGRLLRRCWLCGMPRCTAR